MQLNDDTKSVTWIKRAKYAVAGAVVAALAVFGAATFPTVDAPPVDDQAGGTWSFHDGGDPTDFGGGKGGGGGVGSYGGTWS